MNRSWSSNPMRSPPAAAMTTKLNVSSEGSKFKSGDVIPGVCLSADEKPKPDSGGTEAQFHARNVITTETHSPSTMLADQSNKPKSWPEWLRFKESPAPASMHSSVELQRDHEVCGPARSGGDLEERRQAAPMSWLAGWSRQTALSKTQQSTPGSIGMEHAPTGPSPESAVTDSITDSNPYSPAEVAPSWSFWSRSGLRNGQRTSSIQDRLAVAESPSQVNPLPAVVDQQEFSNVPHPNGPADVGPIPASVDGKENTDSTNNPKLDAKPGDSRSALGSGSHSKIHEVVAQSRNLVLPSFGSTYPALKARPSVLKSMGGWLLGDYALAKKDIPLREPKKIQNALAIGIHGYFPGPIIQSVLGKPTGTSVRFSDLAARAIEDFAIRQGYSIRSLEKIALEGEGRVGRRLETLCKWHTNSLACGSISCEFPFCYNLPRTRLA